MPVAIYARGVREPLAQGVHERVVASEGQRHVVLEHVAARQPRARYALADVPDVLRTRTYLSIIIVGTQCHDLQRKCHGSAINTGVHNAPVLRIITSYMGRNKKLFKFVISY